MPAARIIAALAVGGIGAAAGFTHTHDWAARHGQTGWLAWADAVVIECLVLVAGFEVRRDHQRSSVRRLARFPLAVMIGALAVQMTAQVALAEPTPAGWLVAAMPAASFVIVVKLLLRHTPTTPAAGGPVVPLEEVPVEHPALPAAPVTSVPETPSAGRVRLPAALADRVASAVDDARSEGREVTAEDIRRVARVPRPLADRILTELLDENR